MPTKPSLQPPTPAPGPPTPSRAPLTQFLTRPSKWFARSASAPRVSALSAGDEAPRASTSSVASGPNAGRKPKISRPTDPRPILDAEGYMGVPGSRSVLDLTRPSLNLPSSASSPGAHAKSSLDLRYVPPPSPARSHHNVGVSHNVYGGGGNGDLRTASRRAWAHSADDLRAVGIPLPMPPPSPSSSIHPVPPSPTSPNSPSGSESQAPSGPGLRVNTSISFVDKVAAYRGRSDSTPLSGSASTTGSTPQLPTSTPLGGYTPTPSTAMTSHNSSNMGSFTGAPLTQAPLQMQMPLTSSSSTSSYSPSHSNSLPIQIMPEGAPSPFYARRRTDSERSARSARSARSGRSGDGISVSARSGDGRSGGDGSPGSTPPSARRGSGMAWPTIINAPNGRGDASSSVTNAGVNGGARDVRNRERNGSGGGSPVSISISAPFLAGPGSGSMGASADGNQGGGMPPGHVHTRSHSFTPKLPSRLANFGAPSPGRKSSAGELDPWEQRDGKEKEKRGVGFSFFGGAAQTKALPPTPPSISDPAPLLAPPHIILEPSPPTDAPPPLPTRRADRDRQTRVADHPRAWKPFRMEIRGTKAILHKPPSDRAGEIRDLFAVGIVEDADKDEAEVEVDAGAGAGAGGAEAGGGGRRTKGRIEKGTLEALVHELVFATVFLVAGAPPEEAERQEEEWRDFALAVLFSLPLVAGRARVEVEFLRCATYLLTGAEPEEVEAHRKRVAWMAREYLHFHGTPVDAAAWEDFRAEVIPDVFFSAAQTTPSGLAASVSTQAMYTPTPVGSPALSATPFSPRPDGSSARMVGLLDALGVPSTPGSLSVPHSPQQTARGGLASRMPWAALETEGLTREVLLALDPHVLASSLTLFHRAVLEQAPDNPTATFVLEAEGASSSSSCAPLFGSDTAPHWLTKLVLVQILGVDTGSGAVHGGDQQQQNGTSQGPSSRTHSRGEVISVWARVGELCREAGDECTWRAIVAALCAAPVARLDKVWRRVEGAAVSAVEGWAQLEGEGCEVREPRVTPWGGEIPLRLKEQVDAARGGDAGGAEEALLVAPMQRALDLFEGFRKQFLLCPRRVSLAEDEVSEEVKLMVNYWREKFAEGGGAGGIAAKFIRVDQFMSLSLAAEPRRKGLFEPHYWTRAANQTAPFASLIPLLFLDPLPTTSLIDRAQLLRGRVDSDTNPRLLRIDPQRLDSHHSAHQTRRDLGVLPGLTIPIYDGAVLLTVSYATDGDSSASSRPSSRLPSRPPSSVVPDSIEVGLGRAPSVRVKPGSSQGLDRKTSVARRNSLPSPAQRRTAFISSEPSSEPPLRVCVAAGTLTHLVEILVHGLHNVSVSVADDQGEMSLREGKTRELLVDQMEFSKVWWNTYRSLVSPLVFFELLRKMYIQTRPRGAVPSVAELLYVVGSRTEVLDTIKDWLVRGGGASDMLDDLQLHTAVRSFIDDPVEHIISQSANSSDPGVEQACSTLTEVRSRLRRTFETSTMRPPAPFPSLGHPSTTANGQRARLHTQTREPPDIDRIEPEELVDNLDAMACAAFGNVTEEDLFITSDLLEVQTADRIGWYLAFMPNEETVEIQNIYSYLQDIEPSPLISELGQDSLYRLLPPSIRSCIRAYVIIRKWAISQLVAPRLGLHARQSRMELMLRAIEVTRLRTAPNRTSSPGSLAVVDLPCPRSFVEAVLTSAVLSVESRLHNRPWLNIAISRGVQCDSIASLLSQPATQTLSSTRELTIDVGYFLERMLEIIGAPDVVESAAQQEGHSLINFDKRRLLSNLIISVRKRTHREDVTRRAFERLNNIEKEVWLLQFDHRGIKEEALREGSSGPGSSPAAARRTVRPFQKTIALQVEKNRRDRTLRTRILKERVQEQTKNDKREEVLSKAMRKQPATPQQKHQRGKKSMSAFLHFMRPISSAFGSETFHHPAVRRTAEELDFIPASKPSLVVSLVEARVAQFINNDRSFTFQLDTEDGGHYLLQALDKREMRKWLDTINRVTQTAAKRRLTYLGNLKPQLADHLHDPVAASRDPLAVFGVDLMYLLRRESGSDDIPPGAIPSVIERCLGEIEARGLTEVGIYRLAGAASTITALKDAFNRGEDPIDSFTDIHAVCDLVKSWFRVLPEPLFPSSSYYLAIDAMQLENLDDRLASTRNIVQSLPRPNFDLLKRVSEHLDRVADFEERNQMTNESLAIVFGPNLLRAPQDNFAMILANMAHTHKLVKTLITHFHVIFDEGDVEAEGDAEENEELEDEGVQADEEEEEHFRSESPTHLEDVAEDDENTEVEEDLPPTITAELDQSPLDFSTLSYTLPT
ncbi:Rho GTPase activating protein 22 [Mycena sanguinolenta]|uniref:Rho GTPase activating protein 22 n=1 Tax=Mycena sanguinolenta TaxID=230812 RepID=A0A8H7CSS9_9AGAR|nr:Rho GTPase activating protein 22 [Mycena sanguinolenta]